MIKIHEGDCLEVMDLIPDDSIDMVCCDLPYGTTKCSWDTPLDLVKLWEQYNRVTKRNAAILLFAQTPFDKLLGVSNLKNLRYEWVWEKPAATGHLNAKKMPLKAHENILVFYRKLPTYNPQKTTGHKPVNSYTKRRGDGECYGKTVEVTGGGATDRYPRSIQIFSSDKQKNRLHPTQKPIELIKYLIATYSNQGDTVLDNCMGSGTTGVACKNMKRNFIGIELESKIFKVAKARIGQDGRI